MSFTEGVFSGAKILITGHTGFKGSWLSLWLKHLGANVTGVSIDIPTVPSHFIASKISSLIEDRRVDILDYEKINTLIKTTAPDYVFHLAAQSLVGESYDDPINTWKINTIGTINLLESLRNINNSCVAVFITSDKSYNNVEWSWGYRENDPLGGADPYSASKAGAEFAISSYMRSYFNKEGNIRIGIGRAGNVIGGGDWAKNRLIPDCISAWSKGEIVKLRNPHSTRPWQHVLEPLSGYLTLAMELSKDSNLNGEAFNFGPTADQNNTVFNLVDEMSKHWDMVKWENTELSKERNYEAGLLKLNCDKALAKLEWKATWDFNQTVKNTVEWYQNYYNEKNKIEINKFTNNQIIQYINSAKLLGIKWAQ